MILIKILDALEAALKFISTVLMAAVVLILFYAVVMRYVLKMPPGWSMEVGKFLFLWMIMFCAALVTREQSHIGINFVVGLMPPKARFAWLTLVRVMMIGFCYVMVRYGLAILPAVSEAKSPTMDISMGYMYASVPVCGLLMGLYLVEIIIRSFVRQDWLTSPREA